MSWWEETMTQDRTAGLMTKLHTFWYDRPERVVDLQSIAYSPHMYRVEGTERVLSRITAKAWADRGWVQIVRDRDPSRKVLLATLHLTEEGWEIVAAMAE
jgi:hypothetical protein